MTRLSFDIDCKKPSAKNRSFEIIARLKNELKSFRQRAEYWEVMAMTDDLTGLHNRRLLSDTGRSLIEKRNAGRASDTTLLFIDLDDFGKLNKKYGDDVGDDALKALADGLRKKIREEDIAIRKGGDEFVIILIGADEKQTNDVVLKRIERLLDGDLAIHVGEERIEIRGSVGAFPYNRDESPLDNIKRADVLMREKKMIRKCAALAAAQASATVS